MTPTGFPQVNRGLIGREGQDVGTIADLPVWADGRQCVSCWRPSWRERLSILLFGRVWVSVLFGTTQPPIAVSGARGHFEAG